MVDEYDGPVNDPGAAARAVAAMGGADLALLANHGVFVLAGSVRAAHQRAVALEQRCRHAWHVEALGAAARCPNRRGRSSSGRTARGSWASGRPWPAGSCGSIPRCWKADPGQKRWFEGVKNGDLSLTKR